MPARTWFGCFRKMPNVAPTLHAFPVNLVNGVVTMTESFIEVLARRGHAQYATTGGQPIAIRRTRRTGMEYFHVALSAPSIEARYVRTGLILARITTAGEHDAGR